MCICVYESTVSVCVSVFVCVSACVYMSSCMCVYIDFCVDVFSVCVWSCEVLVPYAAWWLQSTLHYCGWSYIFPYPNHHSAHEAYK